MDCHRVAEDLYNKTMLKPIKIYSYVMKMLVMWIRIVLKIIFCSNFIFMVP